MTREGTGSRGGSGRSARVCAAVLPGGERVRILRVQGVLLRLHVDAFQSGRDPDEDDDADDPRGIGQAVGGGQQYGPCGIKTVHGRGQSGGGGERASEQPCDSGGGQSEAQAAQQGRGKAGGHGGEADSGQFRPPAREDGKESPAGFRAHGVDEQGQPQLPDGWRHLRARRACRHAREEDGGTAQGEMAEGEGTEKTAQRRAQGQYEHPGFQNGHGDLRGAVSSLPFRDICRQGRSLSVCAV